MDCSVSVHVSIQLDRMLAGMVFFKNGHRRAPFAPEATFICIPMLSDSACSWSLPKQRHVGYATPKSLPSALSGKGDVPGLTR